MSDDQFSIKHPIVSYAFAIMEYVKTTNPEVFKRAEEYASDLTGVHLDDFVLQEAEEGEDEPLENDITDQIIADPIDEEYDEFNDEEQED